MADPLRHPICHAGNRDAAEAMSDQDYILQIFSLEQVGDVVDEGVDTDIGERRCLRSPSPVCVGVKTRCP